MSAPQFLVQTSDGQLHGYFTLQLLLIDLRIHRYERVTLYRQASSLGKIQYVPTTEEELRREAA